MKPKIVIDNDKVYIDGILAKKKYLNPATHCREIFLNNDFVVKIASGKYADYASEQNSKESRLWKRIEETDLVYFAPIVMYSRRYDYVVQKRISMKSRKRLMSDDKIIEYLSKKYKIDDIDGRDDNWCINQETNLPCIFDYGV